ncbi:MAG: glycoside hydrolase N-terminal domain-containing protein [Firmicutes bacterium]|nr:glycoside hydrolase N-terminal domain-containing protein [Bacillota bacterium]
MANIRKPKNALKFSKPAEWWGSTWREGLPAGNGIIGASVLGGACDDAVLINHSDLWWQGSAGVLQDVADKLPAVRKKIEENQAREAEKMLSDDLVRKGFRASPAYPLPLCDFKVSMRADKAVKDYARVLNMENGEVSVSFKDGSTRFERSLFVSRAIGVVCFEITKSGPKGIDVTFSLDAREKFNARTLSAVSKVPEGIQVKYENYFMFFSARSDNATEFGAVAFINHYGGTQVVTPSGITIKGANTVSVLLKPFVEGNREKDWKALAAELKSIKAPYEKLLKEHTNLHNKLFNSAELDLDADNRDEFADKMLDKVFETGEMPPALLEKLWAYGRYLLISGSSPASRPLAPCGLWCGDYKAQDSSITAAGSLQSTYGHALAGNLAGHLNSVFTYYESVINDLRKNASRLYGCRGIMIPSVMAHGTGILGVVEPGIVHTTCVAGWMGQLFYDYYRFTGDIKFLKDRALPFLKEVALFYENFFKVEGDAKFYETCPSYSPGTTPGNFAGGGESMEIARNATADFAIARELLKNLIEGSEIAGQNKGEIAKWRDMLTRIPPYQAAPEGVVREYLDSRFTDNPASLSHVLFYPVYPGTEYGEDALAADIKKAFETGFKKKLSSASGSQTSQGLTYYANIAARFGDGDASLELIISAARAMAMGNLIFAQTDWRGMGIGKSDIWASYTIEPNMSITSAVQEMVVQCSGETIALLPALPSIVNKGTAEGFLTRAGVEILELSWDLKKGSLYGKFKAGKSVKLNVRLPKGVKRCKFNGKDVTVPEGGVIAGMDFPGGKAVTVDAKL